MQAQILSQSGFDLTVKFTFDDNSTSTQVIHYVPGSDPGVTAQQALVNFLTAYATAYQAGLTQVQPPVIADQTLTL